MFACVCELGVGCVRREEGGRGGGWGGGGEGGCVCVIYEGNGICNQSNTFSHPAPGQNNPKENISSS